MAFACLMQRCWVILMAPDSFSHYPKQDVTGASGSAHAPQKGRRNPGVGRERTAPLGLQRGPASVRPFGRVSLPHLRSRNGFPLSRLLLLLALALNLDLLLPRDSSEEV